MFERFTDRSRRVIGLALEEARGFGHSQIGTEHILLGLIHEGAGVAASAIESLGVTEAAVRDRVKDVKEQGVSTSQGQVPFTPRAKKVLELTLREALQLGHNHIGTEHILLAIVREGEGVAAQVLVSLGVELSRVRQRVIQLLSGTDPKSKLQSDRVESNAAELLVGLAGLKQSSPMRVALLDDRAVAATARAFEPSLMQFQRIAGTGQLEPWDEEFLTNTIQQVVLWQRRDGANPQIFELLIADLVRCFIARLADPGPIALELRRLGADAALADELAARVVAAVNIMLELGNADEVVDGSALERIANATDEIAARMSDFDVRPGDQPPHRTVGRAVAEGAAEEVGRRMASGSLGVVRSLISSEWPRLQVGLILAWRAVRDVFLR